MDLPDILVLHTPKTIKDELRFLDSVIADKKTDKDKKKRYRKARNQIKQAIKRTGKPWKI